MFAGKVVSECGISVRDELGASLDGLPDGDGDWLLEIKTRSNNCPCPTRDYQRDHGAY